LKACTASWNAWQRIKFSVDALPCGFAVRPETVILNSWYIAKCFGFNFFSTGDFEEHLSGWL